jgi:hypothetical protein
MSQRGQLSESALHYLIILVCVAAILGVGYYSFSSVQDRLCKTELSKFQLDVKGIDREVGEGSLVEKDFDIPCDADEVYFVDSKKAKAEYFANNIIKDAVASSTEKNVFVVKDGEVSSSFFAGELEMAYPGYSCLVPRSGEVEVFAEGKGRGVEITPGCYQTECTLIPQDVPADEAQQILHDFFMFDCERCPTNVLSEVEDYSQTLQNLNMYRRYIYCPDTGKTKIEIIISPKDDRVIKNFRFYEYIPKECVASLNETLESLSVIGEVFVQDDPLLMWQFDTIERETVIEYTLNKSMSREDCEELIQGMGIAELLQEEGIEDHYAPTIDEFDDEVLVMNGDETQSVSLNDFVHDDVSIDQEIVWEITPTPQFLDVRIEDPTTFSDEGELAVTGSVIADTSTERIGTLEDLRERQQRPYRNNFLFIKPRQNFAGSEVIYLKATDRAGRTSTGSLTVIVTAAPIINIIPDIILHQAGAASKNIMLRESLYILEDSPFANLGIEVSPSSTAYAECSIEGIEDSRSLRCVRLSPGDSQFTLKVTDEHGLSTQRQFTVQVIGQSAAPLKKFKCRSTTSACGYSSYVCTIGTRTQIACCPTNFLSSFGRLVGIDSCWGDNYANIRFSCTGEQWSTCGGSCSEFPGSDIVEDACCNSPGCTAAGSRCLDDSTLVTCADTNTPPDGCLEQTSPSSCANGCRDNRCLPSVCAEDNDCMVGKSCHGGSCKSNCAGGVRHNQCIGDSSSGYNYNTYRCNNGNSIEDSSCMVRCANSINQVSGGCDTIGNFCINLNSWATCGSWTPWTGSNLLCLGYSAVNQCGDGRACQNGACVTTVCSDGTALGSCSSTQIGKKCVPASGSAILQTDPACNVCTPNSYGCYDTTNYRQCNSLGNSWNAPVSCGFSWSGGPGKVCTGAGMCRDRLSISYTIAQKLAPCGSYSSCCKYTLTLINNQNNQMTITNIISAGSGISNTIESEFTGDINIPINGEGSTTYVPQTYIPNIYSELQFMENSDLKGKIPIIC